MAASTRAPALERRRPHEAGPVPLFQALDARAKGPGTPVDRPVGYGFPVRICDQDPTAPIYLYSATISSIDRFDLVFDAVEPPFGTPISPGGRTDVCFDAAAAGDGGPTFIANLLIRWGHTLPVGSDPDHPGVLGQVLVGG
jgi:hypothetical protein